MNIKTTRVRILLCGYKRVARYLRKKKSNSLASRRGAVRWCTSIMHDLYYSKTGICSDICSLSWIIITTSFFCLLYRCLILAQYEIFEIKHHQQVLTIFIFLFQLNFYPHPIFDIEWFGFFAVVVSVYQQMKLKYFQSITRVNFHSLTVILFYIDRFWINGLAKIHTMYSGKRCRNILRYRKINWRSGCEKNRIDSIGLYEI